MDFSDFRSYRLEAVKYWERRRIVWNLLLVPPSLLMYWMRSQVYVEGNIQPELGADRVLALFLGAAFAANICYTFAYVAEFLMADSRKNSGWVTVGRGMVFAIGCVLGIGLAAIGGREIASLRYEFLAF